MRLPPALRVATLEECLEYGFSFPQLRRRGLLPPIGGGADAHANFAYSTVLTAPSPALSGVSLVVQSGDGANFPAVPFNATVCPAGQRPTVANAEIVRATARSTDTLTITRAQEGTSARSILVGDQIYNAPTKKTFTDIEAVPGRTFRNAAWTTVASTITFGYDTVASGEDASSQWSGANFTCSAAGWYLVQGTISCVSSATGQFMLANIGRTTGGAQTVVAYGSLASSFASGNTLTSHFGTIVKCALNDTLQNGYNATAGLVGSVGNNLSYMSVIRVALT